MVSLERDENCQVVTHVNEYERLARRTLTKEAYDFISKGAEGMWTLRENLRAFQTIRLRPQLMMDVSRVETSTEVLGFKISMPIIVGPSSLHKMAHSEGELATARAASAENTVMVLSSSSTTTLEDVDMTGPGVRFFQLYIYKDREVTAEVVRRAERASYKAIVLTADAPYLGRREADIKNRFTLPPNLTLINFERAVDPADMSTTGSTSVVTAFTAAKIDKSVTWKDIAWLKDITSLPILIKGVLTAEDARLAVECGAAGIIVSNHGGRQLDYSPPAIDVLEEVVEAVEGKVPIFCDGGIRHGSDVFKALALGAAGVLIGRPVIYGLAVNGEAGVRKILQTLRDEFKLAMSMAGCCRVRDISRAHIQIRKEATVTLGSKL